MSDETSTRGSPPWWNSENKTWFWEMVGSERFRNLATVSAVIAALFSLIVTSCNQQNAISAQKVSIIEQSNQQKSSIDFQAEKAANDAWIIFRQVEKDFFSTAGGPHDVIAVNDENRRQAFLVLERLMMAADIVTISLGEDRQWAGAFGIEFQRYKNAIIDTEFVDEKNGQISEFCTYRHPVHVWIEDAFRNDGKRLKDVKEAQTASQVLKVVEEAHVVCKRRLCEQKYSDELGAAMTPSQIRTTKCQTLS